MQKKFEKLEKDIKSDSSGGFQISKKLYDALHQELIQMTSLVSLVEKEREKGLLRVVQGEIISEQVDQFFVPEQGVDTSFLSEYRAFRKAQQIGEEYEGSFSQPDYDVFYKKIKRFLKNGAEDIPMRLDVFEKRLKGEIFVYEVMEDCSVREFFEHMGCETEEDIFQSFCLQTLNLFQVDWLYKHGKILRNVPYILFSRIGGKIIPLRVISHSFGETCYWAKATFKKGTKILLFSSEGS